MAGKRFSRRHVLTAAMLAGGVALGQVLYSGLVKAGLLAGRASSPLFLPFVSKEAASGPTATPTPSSTSADPTVPSATATHTTTSTSLPDAPTVTATPSITPSVTGVPGPTETASNAATATATQTAISTPTATPSVIPTTPSSGKPRVVHVFNAQATSWDYATGYYGDYVDQDIVNAMVDAGVTTLTGAPTVAQAWQQLLSAVSPYSPGKRIVIKVNFNNHGTCDTPNTPSDALVHPVNAVIRGLQAAGVQLADIWIVEPSRALPARFINGCPYKNEINLLDKNGSKNCGATVIAGTWKSADPHAVIQFSAAGLEAQRLSDALIDATYFINMPLLRVHGITGFTLGFKNLMGCLPKPIDLHDFIDAEGVPAHPGSHPWVDIFQNPHVRAKHVLTLDDALYGQRSSHTKPPNPWNTFQEHLGTPSPNSLFFATDPVAVDSVMADFIRAEEAWRAPDWATYYLQLAEAVGLGIFEKGDPWGAGYSRLDYVRLIL